MGQVALPELRRAGCGGLSTKELLTAFEATASGAGAASGAAMV